MYGSQNYGSTEYGGLLQVVPAESVLIKEYRTRIEPREHLTDDYDMEDIKTSVNESSDVISEDSYKKDVIIIE